MQLDDRKKKILQAIIDDYIDTAEPVGSRTIVKKYQLGLSSATIRNEMADLEDMGYLKQPHTSAGRVPSLSGYRLYVDELMTQYSLTVEEINVLRSAMEMKIDYLDKIIARASEIMSEITDYTSVVSGPKLKTGAIKHLRLVYIEHQLFLAIIVTNEGLVKDKKSRYNGDLQEDELLRLENAINRHIIGIDFSQITQQRIYDIIMEANVSRELVLSVFEFMQECMDLSAERDVYVKGTTNILNFPEYADIERAKRFLNFVGNRKDIIQIFSDTNKEGQGITITIGGENANSQMKDCSVITSRYKIGDSMEGFIGLIGPVRMDYKRAVSIMKHVTAIMNSKMLELTGQEEGHKHGKEKEKSSDE